MARVPRMILVGMRRGLVCLVSFTVVFMVSVFGREKRSADGLYAKTFVIREGEAGADAGACGGSFACGASGVSGPCSGGSQASGCASGCGSGSGC